MAKRQTTRRVSKIPKWRKPPVDVPVKALRNFMARYGADVSVLVTWTHETNSYQFVTIGCDQFHADNAVNLRNIIANAVGVINLDSTIEDLRGDHPNVVLTSDQINFMLWLLGRIYAESEKKGSRFKKYVTYHHDKVLAALGRAKSIMENKPS